MLPPVRCLKELKIILLKLIKDRTGEKIDEYKEFIKISGETKEDLSELINCKSSEIAFIDNTSNGINIIAQGLRLKKGDGILLNDIEFPANVYPFLNLKSMGLKLISLNHMMALYRLKMSLNQ